jgi:hypothetical protein
MKMTAILMLNLKYKLLNSLIILAFIASATFVLPATALAQKEETQLQLDLPPPDVPKPQLFCGYCHVLTYPGVVQKGYELWKKGKHNKVGCVECHYRPGTSTIISPSAATTETTKASHIPSQPPGHFSYLPIGGDTIKTRPQIADASCMTTACHRNPDQKIKNKKKKIK